MPVLAVNWAVPEMWLSAGVDSGSRKMTFQRSLTLLRPFQAFPLRTESNLILACSKNERLVARLIQELCFSQASFRGIPLW